MQTNRPFFLECGYVYLPTYLPCLLLAACLGPSNCREFFRRTLFRRTFFRNGFHGTIINLKNKRSKSGQKEAEEQKRWDDWNSGREQDKTWERV